MSFLVVETEYQRHMPKGFKSPHIFYKTPYWGLAIYLLAAFDTALKDDLFNLLDGVMMKVIHR